MTRVNVLHKAGAKHVKQKHTTIFYSNLRPLALFCKLCGTFSLRNCFQRNGYLLQHKWISIDTFWGPFLCTVFALLFKLNESNEWFQFLMPYVMTRYYLSCLVCFFYDKRLLKLIAKIEDFEMIYKNVSTLQKRFLGFNYKLHLGLVWLIGIMVYLASCFVMIFLSMPATNDIWAHLLGASLGITTVTQRVLFIYTYLFFCLYLTLCFRDIRALFANTFRDIQDNPVHSYWLDFDIIQRNRVVNQYLDLATRKPVMLPEAPEVKLERVRLLHCCLVQATCYLSECFGPKIATFLGMIFVEFLLDLYQGVYVFPVGSVVQDFFFLFNFTTLFLVASLSGGLTKAGSEVYLELVQARMSQLSAPCLVQIQAFLSQLSVAQLEVQASGFCTVNRGLLVSMVITLTTYFIVIVQFAPQLKQYTDRFRTGD